MALEHDIAVYQPEKLKGSEELEALLQLDSDLIVTAAFGQLLPEVLLENLNMVQSMFMPPYYLNIEEAHQSIKPLLMVKQKRV